MEISMQFNDIMAIMPWIFQDIQFLWRKKYLIKIYPINVRLKLFRSFTHRGFQNTMISIQIPENPFRKRIIPLKTPENSNDQHPNYSSNSWRLCSKNEQRNPLDIISSISTIYKHILIRYFPKLNIRIHQNIMFSNNVLEALNYVKDLCIYF